MSEAGEVLGCYLYNRSMRNSCHDPVLLLELEHALAVICGDTLDAFRCKIPNSKGLGAKVAMVLATDKHWGLNLLLHTVWQSLL